MRRLLGFLLVVFFMATLLSCSSLPTEDSLDETEAVFNSADDFDEGFEKENEQSLSTKEDVEQDVEGEIAELSGEENEEESINEVIEDEIAQEEDVEGVEDIAQQESEVAAEEPINESPEESMEEVAEVEEVVIPEAVEPQEVVEEETAEEEVAETIVVTNNSVKSIDYKSQSGSETVIIETKEEATYQTRVNENLNQLVVEIEGAQLPSRLKRPFDTSQFGGGIGAVQAYQGKGSNTARIIIQLAEGASVPEVVQEGRSLFVISKTLQEAAEAENIAEFSSESSKEQGTLSGEGVTGSFSDNRVLPAANLDEFLASNTKFYGNKISIQSKDVDVRDVIGMIAEESGANLVISDDVRGKLSIKLRDVPWDQALVMVMKAKGLAYVRSGNILRIAKAQNLRKEIEQARELLRSKRRLEPLKVSVIPVSYAKVESLSKKITAFIKTGKKNPRATVLADQRTSSLILTSTDETYRRVQALVGALDTPPQQVLIEGKIIEARETFTKSMGVSWSFLNGRQELGTSASGTPINMQPNLRILDGAGGGGALAFDLTVGKYDLFGNINAMLALNEQNNNVRVLSAPSILTLNNEKASIKQTVQVANTTAVSQNGVVSYSISLKPAQLSLDVQPHITSDDSILLNVDLKREFPGAQITAGQATATPINSRSAKANVMVRNGQTAVFGGIYQNDTTLGETGVPFLKDIPVLGNLFKTKNRNKQKTELLLFLTPRIVNEKELSSSPRELLTESQDDDSESL